MKKSAHVHILTVDLGKFVYCWFIVFYHFYLNTADTFPGGKYGVEFYLLAAGVFFFRHLEHSQGETPGRYIGHRFARLFPWTLTAYALAFVVIRLYIDRTFTLGSLAGRLSQDLWEVLLVKMNGMNLGESLLNSPAWTVSSMFLVEIVLVGFFFACKKPFVRVLLPASLMAGFGIWRHVPSAGSTIWIGLTTFGTLRAWLVYGCAWYCYRLSGALGRAKLSRRAERALTGLATALHAFAIWAMLTQDSRNYQWCVLLAFFLAMALTISGHNRWNAALQKLARPIRFLGALSLSVFLVHWPVIRLFQTFYPAGTHAAVVTAAITLCSLAHYALTAGLIRLCQRMKPRLTALLLKQA